MSRHRNPATLKDVPKRQLGHATRDEHAAMVKRLQTMKKECGYLPNRLVREVAESIGISATSLRRHMRIGMPAKRVGRNKWTPTPECLEAYWYANGNASRAYRMLAKSGDVELPALGTFIRAVHRELKPHERVEAKAGRLASRNFVVYGERAETVANFCLEGDAFKLDLPIVPLRGSKPTNAWMVLFADSASRGVSGWAINLTPDRGTVLAALGNAVRANPDRGPFRGVPQTIRWDKGLEFNNQGLKEAASMLGVVVNTTAAYQPWEKGKIERLGRTIMEEALFDLPFYSKAPRSQEGVTAAEEVKNLEPISLEMLVAVIEATINDYNCHRIHSALNGRTPAQAWVDMQGDIEMPDEAVLRRFLLEGEYRTVTKKGVRMNNLHYVSPKLHNFVGEIVEVRSRPHDDRAIEIYVGDEHLATAKPAVRQSDAERRSLAAARSRGAARAEEMRAKTNRRVRARTRLAPMTTPEAPVVSQLASDPAGESSSSHSTRKNVDDLGLSGKLNRPRDVQEGS